MRFVFLVVAALGMIFMIFCFLINFAHFLLHLIFILFNFWPLLCSCIYIVERGGFNVLKWGPVNEYVTVVLAALVCSVRYALITRKIRGKTTNNVNCDVNKVLGKQKLSNKQCIWDSKIRAKQIFHKG